MSERRRFCRFSRSPETAAFGFPEVPEGGFCLSAFVLLTSREKPHRVLMGRLNPAADWERLGALDASRVEAHRHGWMLPSSHLLFGESPQEAAARIVREQLERPPQRLDGPLVVSEVYTPKRFPDRPRHWDLEFLFRGSLPERERPRPAAWIDLAFVDPREVSRRAIARSHEDVLASAGLFDSGESADGRSGPDARGRRPARA